MKVIRYLGYVLLISAFFRIIPIVTALIYGEQLNIFVFSAFLSFFTGSLLVFITRDKNPKELPLNLTRGLMLVALSFLVLSLMGSISFLPHFNYRFIDALFESVSGFTTTGMTLFDSLDGLPKSLLIWRSLTQWLGGVGILMVFLFIFSRLKAHAFTKLSEAEEHLSSTTALYQAQGFPEQMDPGLKNTTRSILLIYLGYTAIGIMLLFLVGMPLYDSIAMTFTSLSTGGFTVSDQFFSNNAQLGILSLLMIIGAISFLTHNKIIHLKIKEFFIAQEKNVFLVIIAIGIGLALIVTQDIWTVVFEIISAFTTTGFSTTSIALLPQLFIFLIMIGMMIGGCVASTAGGIKVFRIYTLIRAVPWILKKLSSPKNAVIPFKMGDRQIEESNLLIVGIFVFTYSVTLIMGITVFLILGNSFLDSSFQVVSALGTVGLQTTSLASAHWIGKLFLIIAMLLGRLEIFPLLVLVRNLIKK